VLAVIRRTRRGVGIGHADKEHLHHHLMDIARGHRQAVLLMYLWSALISGSAVAIALINGRPIVALILVAAGSVFLVTALPRMARRRGPNGVHAIAVAEDPPGATADAQAGNVSGHD
jgi:UDP-GlcNAc:undecaprenyl-phosphate GlcNAc-1-phosphate transferase